MYITSVVSGSLEMSWRSGFDVDEVCVLGVPDPSSSGKVPVTLAVLKTKRQSTRASKDDKEAQKITVSIMKGKIHNSSPAL